MRKTILCLLFGILLVCGCDSGGVTGEPQSAARWYVEQLGKGNYDAWLNGMQSLDNASDKYKQRQQTLLKQLMFGRVGKLSAVETTDADVKGDSVADVYVRLTWEGDSAETILIGLIRDGKRWCLR